MQCGWVRGEGLRLSELLVFSALLGSTVAPGDDFFELFVFSAMLSSTVASGDDFVKCSVFSAMLGSTVPYSAQSLVRFWIHALRQSTELAPFFLVESGR